MKKIILLSCIVCYTIVVQAQLRRIATPQNKKQIESRSVLKKNAAQFELDSTQFQYHNAYLVGLYFSKFYLAAIDFHPSYIINGTSAQTKVEYAFYNTNGALLASYTSGNNPWPSDPYNNHPLLEVELQVHGGHKLVELMNKPCVLKITMLPINDDTVKIARIFIAFKCAQSYYPENLRSSNAEYSLTAFSTVTQWFRSAEDIVLTLTKAHPTVSLLYQYNKQLVANYSADMNTVFKPIY